MKHTSKPWKDKQFRSTIMSSEQFYLDWADWNHSKACVNACEGINPEVVPDLLKELKRIKKVLSEYGHISSSATATIKRIQYFVSKAKLS